MLLPTSAIVTYGLALYWQCTLLQWLSVYPTNALPVIVTSSTQSPSHWSFGLSCSSQFHWAWLLVARTYQYCSHLPLWLPVMSTMKPLQHLLQPPRVGITSSSTHPFGTIKLNHITGLPLSQGFDALLVIVDHNITKGEGIYSLLHDRHGTRNGTSSYWQCIHIIWSQT